MFANSRESMVVSMFDLMRVKFYQFLEHWLAQGLFSAVKFTFYKYEEAVLVTKDLFSLKPIDSKFVNTDLSILEINRGNYKDNEIRYVLKSRSERVARYVKKGYQSFCLVKNRQIIGDLWYVPRSSARTEVLHPCLRWFGITLSDDEVYMFDMYMAPDFRGDGITTFFMNSTLHLLRKKGFNRAYGYFANHNISALWVHRIIGWQELEHFEVKRFFLHETAKPKVQQKNA
jgi:GNAT superfamily N-acetyltransferase